VPPMPSHSRANSSNSIPSASNPFASPKEKKDAKDRKEKDKKEKDKKGSRHADVIDKLDPSGFWGTGSESRRILSYDIAWPTPRTGSSSCVELILLECYTPLSRNALTPALQPLDLG
jgi:hypothetical protein